MYWYVLVCIGMSWYVLVCTGMYWYVLVCTSVYSDFQFTNSVLPRYSIHGGTWKYMAVPESPVLPDLRRYIKVDGSTKPCTLMYLDPAAVD